MKKYILISLIFVSSVFGAAAQELFMTSIAPISELVITIPEDFKYKPTKGYASSYQEAEEIEKAFDGNYSTIYHSSWEGATSPITLRFDFDNIDLDYLVYHPRTTGSNGLFKEVQIFYTTADSEEKIKLGDYDFEGSKLATTIKFPTTLKNVKSIEFQVISGVTDSSGKMYASCAEMEFYALNPKRVGDSNIFADNLLTTLKEGVTEADIDDMDTPYYRELARAIYRGDYSLEFRKGEFLPYMTRAQMSEKYLVNNYNLYENPTGIYFPIGKHVIMVEDLAEGQSIKLDIPNYTGGNKDDWSLKSRSYPLQNGLNVIEVKEWGGVGYISYFTPDWETASSVNLHFPLGTVQGYFDIAKHKTNEKFVELLANANAYSFFDVVGKRIHLAYTVDAYRNYTEGKAVELLDRYDEMILWQQRYMGWEKYLTLPKNRIHSRANQSYYMYKDNSGVSFEHGTMNTLANAEKFYNSNWGPCHEVGHIHQYKFNNWTGLGEVSVNYPNLVFVKNVLAPMGKGEVRPNLQKCYNSIAKKNATTITIPFLKYHKDIYPEGEVDHNDGRLGAFAQLYYYFEEKGYKDFFPDLNQALRETTDNTSGWGPAQYEMNFIKKVCDLTELNLIPFFEKWGMLYYTDADGRSTFAVGDYSSGTYSLKKSVVDEFKAYIAEKQYPEPTEDLTLIDRNGKRLNP